MLRHLSTPSRGLPAAAGSLGSHARETRSACTSGQSASRLRALVGSDAGAPFPQLHRRLTITAVGLLLASCYLLFAFAAERRDLWSSHEARAAQNAQTILDMGEWALPRLFDGRLEMQKPPLYYWLVAGLAWIRHERVDALDVRLPAVITGSAGVLGLFWFGCRSGRPVLGLASALGLATMLHYTWLARVGRIDMPLTLTVGAAIACCYLGLAPARDSGDPGSTPRRVPLLLAAYVAAALSVLLKGPIGPVLIGVVLGCWLLLEGHLLQAWRRRSLFELPHRLGFWWGIPLFLLLTLPWFLWVNRETAGEFFEVFFYRHNFQRGLGGDAELDGHQHPWWFYLVRVWPDLFPWSLALPFAVIYMWRTGEWRRDPLARLGGIWFVSILLLLSCFRFKRADYFLPAYPGAALLLGAAAECLLARLRLPWRRAVQVGFWSAIGCCALGWSIFAWQVLPAWEGARENRTFAEEVRRHVPAPGLVLLFRTEAHGLVFHLGRPIERLMEWENLDIWACQPVPVYVVMPLEEAAVWRDHLEAGELHEVVTNSALAGVPHDEPLALLCTRPITH